MKLLNKLTVAKVLGCAVAAFAEEEKLGTERLLMTVWGRADGFKNGVTVLPDGKESEWTKFNGDFRAKASDIQDEKTEEQRSAHMILPAVAGDLLRNLFSEEVTSIQFAFIIGVSKTAKGKGYEFYAKPLVESDANDPLASLTANLKKALPAPTAAPETAPKPKK